MSRMRWTVSFLMPAIMLATGLCTPSRMATAASPPSVWTIMAMVNKATAQQGSVHGLGTSTFLSTRKTQQGSVSYTDKGGFTADADTTNAGNSTVREKITHSQSGVQTSLTLDYSTKGSHVATHVEGHKSWSCGNTNTVLNSIDVWTPTSFGLGITKKTSQKQGARVKLMGSTTYRGHAVWKIFSSSSKTNSKTKVTASATFMLLVDKSTNLAPYYAWSQEAKGPGGQSKIVSSVDLTKYGGALAINMHGCK